MCFHLLVRMRNAVRLETEEAPSNVSIRIAFELVVFHTTTSFCKGVTHAYFSINGMCVFSLTKRRTKEKLTNLFYSPIIFIPC